MPETDTPETELSKALRLILSPDFAANETATRETQGTLPSTGVAHDAPESERLERAAAYELMYLERCIAQGAKAAQTALDKFSAAEEWRFKLADTLRDLANQRTPR